MNIQKIVPDIFYVGVNDRVTTLFEGLWPLPYGVSYNSYLVRGTEKVALIDTVRINEVREFLGNIEMITGQRKIDYLVVNHMEPDHSGSIPEVVCAFPDIKIIGNARTICMIKGFYHIDGDHFIEVKDGDEIDLGGHRLQFHITPMVHWPETMMTYVPDLRLLFSGDAFGTFGALSGAVVDKDMDTSVYFPEMYRYYSNIVGKYGRFVQNALKKLSPLPLDYICSTHGPVWNKQIPEVVGIVDRLSKYESEPGATVIYGSMYGNTAEVAEEIARQLSARGIKPIHIHDASHSSMSDMITDAFRYKILIVGSATYSMRLFPPVEQFMNAMETREIKNKIFATFESYTWSKGLVEAKLAEFAGRLGIPVVASMSMMQSVSDDSRQAARLLADKVADSYE